MKARNGHPSKVEWKAHLYAYPSRKALAFADRRERDRLLASLWEDEQLYGMPRDYAGALLLIVPEDAVAVLRKKGFKFAVRDVAG
ncbi:MAG: hypothetical protein C5B50_00340 [Verrucomicrobia bacterium]|nr:MAG: hypothetical protein C5B50_00340 [Verrucomicrobiota bacterium]